MYSPPKMALGGPMSAEGGRKCANIAQERFVVYNRGELPFSLARTTEEDFCPRRPPGALGKRPRRYMPGPERGCGQKTDFDPQRSPPKSTEFVPKPDVSYIGIFRGPGRLANYVVGKLGKHPCPASQVLSRGLASSSMLTVLCI